MVGKSSAAGDPARRRPELPKDSDVLYLLIEKDYLTVLQLNHDPRTVQAADPWCPGVATPWPVTCGVSATVEKIAVGSGRSTHG
jgi:hypothetical protein